MEPKSKEDDSMLILPDITKKQKPFFLQSKFDKEKNYSPEKKKLKTKESQKVLLSPRFDEDNH